MLIHTCEQQYLNKKANSAAELQSSAAELFFATRQRSPLKVLFYSGSTSTAFPASRLAWQSR